jgi:ubiquitin-conjugating enzyme E2 Q
MSMFKKLFRKSTKDGPSRDEPQADADAADQAAKVQEALTTATSPSNNDAHVHTKPTSDGGASLYRKLESEAQLKAISRSQSTDDAVVSSSPSFSMALPGTTKALQAVASQSQAVRSTRLMKELERIQKSDSVKSGVFSVSLADDNLFEWDLKYYKFDPESALANDLANMAIDYNIDNVWFRFSFPENFPFAPPFVRVIAPLVQGGFVLTGGAICQELLTPQGWVQSCKMEAVILAVAASITKAGARIVPSVHTPFGEREARKAYDYLVKTHAKYGWKEDHDEG